MMVFCTLFNSGYLDKGMVMFQSLLKQTKNFRLYVVAFDDKCYSVLQNYKYEQLIVISLSEFEDERLLEAKSNRTAQEYCWTCSCFAIKYVIEKYNEKICTYIDADMYFYSKPQVLFDEIENSGCDVSIIEHRLSDNFENRRIMKLSGRFCIEFNTFYATDNGLKILNWWCDRCFELCTVMQDGIHFGDQKYLDDWETRFNGVHVLQHKGAGVAPWNIARYRLIERKGNSYKLKFEKEKQIYDLVFYHFQAIKYLDDNEVDVGINLYPGCAQQSLYKKLYEDYMLEIELIRKELESKYNIDLRKNTAARFDKKRYLIDDILGERHPTVILYKLWRLFVRKNRDFMRI